MVNRYFYHTEMTYDASCQLLTLNLNRLLEYVV